MVENLNHVESPLEALDETKRDLATLDNEVRTSAREKSNENIESGEPTVDEAIHWLGSLGLYGSFEKMMSEKDSKRTIEAIQVLLKNKGYDVGQVDGFLKTKGKTTSKTMEAIKKFQKDNKITPVDGVPGPRTVMNLLDAHINTSNPVKKMINSIKFHKEALGITSQDKKVLDDFESKIEEIIERHSNSADLKKLEKYLEEKKEPNMESYLSIAYFLFDFVNKVTEDMIKEYKKNIGKLSKKGKNEMQENVIESYEGIIMRIGILMSFINLGFQDLDKDEEKSKFSKNEWLDIQKTFVTNLLKFEKTGSKFYEELKKDVLPGELSDKLEKTIQDNKESIAHTEKKLKDLKEGKIDMEDD